MKAGFIEEFVDTRSSNGIDDTFLSPLTYVDTDGTTYQVPIQATTDGGSIPLFAQIVPGFQPLGKHWFEWALHDSGYRGTLLVLKDGKWVKANLSRLQCDAMLRRSLALSGMGPVRRNLVYSSVRAVGWKHYKTTSP